MVKEARPSSAGGRRKGQVKAWGLLSAETDVDDLEVVEAVAKDEASGTLAGLAARGAGPAAGHKRWQQLAVPAVKDGVLERSERVINSVQLDVVLSRPLGPAGDADCTVSPVTIGVLLGLVFLASTRLQAEHLGQCCRPCREL